MTRTQAALFAAIALAGCGAAPAANVSTTVATQAVEAPWEKPVEPVPFEARLPEPDAPAVELDRSRCGMLRSMPAWCRE
jgi:hypothetical protein